MLNDEIFWWSKKISMGSCDPKRIQRRLRTSHNSQKQLMNIRMASTDIERGKIKISKNSMKMTSS
jgi:predicted DNA binding CopG/RHH family protein